MKNIVNRRSYTDKKTMYQKGGTNAEICDFLSGKSISMVEYVKNHPDSDFTIFFKYIKFADLSGRGKAKKNGKLSDNLLNYLTVTDMERVSNFPVAAQTNISLSKDCLEILGIVDKVGPLDSITWFVVNDTLEFFNYKYTNQVCSKLGKKADKFRNTVFSQKENGHFTEVKISKAAHGIGAEKDTNFNNLRCSIFCKDKLYLVIEKPKATEKKNVFFLLEKAPIFFNLIGVCSETWKKYLEFCQKQEDASASDLKKEMGEKKTRACQSEWKRKLADEMQNYAQTSDYVTCPFTWKRASFETVPMLFIASHIVPFAECKAREAYDVHNGLLLTANADALFDKHLISVDDNGKLVFSKKINNEIFKKEFSLLEPIMQDILTPERKAYLHRHYLKFAELERTMKDQEDYNLNRSEMSY